MLLVIVILLAATGFHHQAQVKLLQHHLALTTPAKLPVPATVTLPTVTAADKLPFPIGENSGVLWNLTTGQLMWQDNPHLKGPLASTTKLMTIYLILLSLPLSQQVTISPTAAGTSGSDIRMAVGNHFTVRQLLYALMMRSANDSAVALAEADAGGVGAFVQKMNHTAQILGMAQTSYGDPDGLSPQSSGSAWDLAIIARLDMEDPLFRQIVHTKRTALPYNPIVTNLNGLLYMDPTVIGVKTGWTTEAGFNLVFAATRRVTGKPVTVLGVIMHGQNGFPPEYQDAENILNWAYGRLKSGSTTSAK